MVDVDFIIKLGFKDIQLGTITSIKQIGVPHLRNLGLGGLCLHGSESFLNTVFQSEVVIYLQYTTGLVICGSWVGGEGPETCIDSSTMGLLDGGEDI
jgi:hypothetical protein